MSWLEVHALISSGESATLELERGADPKQLGPVLAALANSDGGILVLGVEDDCRVCGVLEPPERVSERLTDFLQSGLPAPVQVRIDRHQEGSSRVYWIEVPRQRGLEPLRYGGRVNVRRGRTSVEPAPSELHDLYNLFGHILTEEQLIDASNPSEIDERAFEAFMTRLGVDLLEEPRMSLDDDLRNRGVLGIQGGALKVALYGALAFGRSPQRYPKSPSRPVEPG